MADAECKDGSFEIGDAVELIGLVSAAHHNGSLGRIVSFLPEKERFAVRLPQSDSHPGGTVLTVKPGNLRSRDGDPFPVGSSSAENENALRKIAQKGDCDEIVRLCLLGTSVNTVNNFGETPLHLAAARGHEQAVRLLVKLGAEVNVVAAEASGVQAVHVAAAGGHESLLRHLVNCKADAKARDADGLTPVHHAAAGGFDATVRTLVDMFGADAKARDNDGLAPLHAAAHKGHDSTVRLLVADFGADANVADNDGETSLHMASMEGRESTVRILLDLGASTSSLNGERLTPAQIAREEGHTKIGAILEEAEMSVKQGAKAGYGSAP
eukprot:TRINITY_DN27369_c0_g1_i1.p1 TRINITY_DN27369_c0_g1~~TRINITY_DN27369_c0_g1_i1.p1  ORF type:complete len:326 (-),score=73.82 TRINITY_DN27369_c0_g1_i1:56-1033(-)